MIEQAVRLASVLQVYSQKDLQKTTIRESNIDRLLEKSGIRSGSFDNMFPTMFSLHGLDIRSAINRAIKNGDITKNAGEVSVEGFSRAMVELSDKYPVLDMDTFRQIEHALNDFANTLEVSSTTISNNDILELRNKLTTIKSLFKKPYLVSYNVGGPGTLPSVKLIHNSFSNLRGIINPIIKKHVSAVLSEKGITNSKLHDSNYLTTKIINWGHTATGTSIISGKLIASLMSLKNLSINNPQEVLSIITKDFLKETGQEKTVIKLHHGELTKGDTTVLNLVLESTLFQKVIAQNRRENQEDLGQLETKWSLLEAVNRSGSGLLNALNVANITELATKLINTRSSPSVVDNIGRLIASTISGTKLPSTKKTVPLLNSTKKIVKNKKIVKVSGKIDSRLNLDTEKLVPSINLTSLQALINQHLQSVISANMGDGSSRNILNYRTGRFAASAAVERMSQSRAGMITAFYTYMKNPYQTFEPGYRQGSPKSRDPKLLISKSIREIAADKVGNRLRAVLV